jgi:hypothetical protein
LACIPEILHFQRFTILDTFCPELYNFVKIEKRCFRRQNGVLAGFLKIGRFKNVKV